jgi:hypothetical protein
MMLLVSGIAIGTLLVGTAAAVTSRSFTYSNAKTGKLSLSPSDFSPDELDTAGDDYHTTWAGARLTNGSSARCFNTGVHLPSGSKMTSIKFFYKSDASTNFFGKVYRQILATGSFAELASSNPSNDANTLASDVQPVPSALQRVMNGTYAYMVGVCPNTGEFDGAVITYKYFNAGD